MKNKKAVSNPPLIPSPIKCSHKDFHSIKTDPKRVKAKSTLQGQKPLLKRNQLPWKRKRLECSSSYTLSKA